MNHDLAELIHTYKAPQSAHSLVASQPSLNVAGPTGAGKGTLVTYLTQTGDYAPVVSDTTRLPRPHNDGYEVNGVNYWFLTEDQAMQKVKNAEYIEVKAVHEKTMYGTSIGAYQKVASAGRTPVLEIDVQGIEELMDHFPEFEALFLLPPDFDTWQQRLDGRGRMDQAEKIQRFRSALTEIQVLERNVRFHPVVNTEVVDTAHAIITGAYKDAGYREQALITARELRDRTVQYLEEHDAI